MRKAYAVLFNVQKVMIDERVQYRCRAGRGRVQAVVGKMSSCLCNYAECISSCAARDAFVCQMTRETFEKDPVIGLDRRRGE